MIILSLNENLSCFNFLLRISFPSSAIIFYWGINRFFDKLKLHNILFSENYKEEFDCIRNGKIYNDPTVYINITSKKIKSDAPKGKENWFVMINTPHNSGQFSKHTIQQIKKDIVLNSGRFGPYLKCENKSARIENVEDIFSIGLNRAITLIAEAKPGRMSSSIIKDLGEHPEDKKPVRVMKGQFGPYIKYKSLNLSLIHISEPTRPY